MTFKKSYFFWALLLFGIEVWIALFVRDRFVRPILGDFLVVVLLYLGLRSIWEQRPVVIAVVVWLFAVCVEFAQYVRVVEWLGLQGNRWASVVIGTRFDVWDLLSYTLGVLTILWIDLRWGLSAKQERQERKWE